MILSPLGLLLFTTLNYVCTPDKREEEIESALGRQLQSSRSRGLVVEDLQQLEDTIPTSSFSKSTKIYTEEGQKNWLACILLGQTKNC